MSSPDSAPGSGKTMTNCQGLGLTASEHHPTRGMNQACWHAPLGFNILIGGCLLWPHKWNMLILWVKVLIILHKLHIEHRDHVRTLAWILDNQLWLSQWFLRHEVWEPASSRRPVASASAAMPRMCSYSDSGRCCGQWPAPNGAAWDPKGLQAWKQCAYVRLRNDAHLHMKEQTHTHTQTITNPQTYMHTHTHMHARTGTWTQPHLV